MAVSVRYMGSKRSLAPDIAERISSQYPDHAVLDVFAGMCAVGTQLAPRHTVLTNDIHTFAQKVAHALFVEPAPQPTSLIAKEELWTDYLKNRRELRRITRGLLAAEREALSRAGDGVHWRMLLELDEVERTRTFPLEDGFASLSEYKALNSRFPYCLATRYFSFGYFGLEQAIDIDCLRYAIDRGPKGHTTFYLTALIQAMSQCSASPGHFAQYLEPRDRTNTRYIARMRSRSIIDRFFSALDGISPVQCFNRPQNEAFNKDANDLVISLQEKKARPPVIYADPPYSRAQYSRYYHVLETMIKYDYPECDGKGRYRNDRFRTGFSSKREVIDAFDTFINSCAALESPIYISYPSNGLLNQVGVSLGDIMSSHYPNVELVERVVLQHSTMGGAAGRASVAVHEEIYYGRKY